MNKKHKLPTPIHVLFKSGDRVTYTGLKTRYSGKLGTIMKVKTEGCTVQFDYDPVLDNGGVKTSLISMKELKVVSK